VKTVLSSGSVNTDATRASVPKGTSALLLHLFPHDESDQQFTFAHVTFIGRKNENNRKPQILDAKVDGMAFSPRNPDDMPRFEKVMHCLKTEVPQVLVTRCTSAFPTHVEDLHKSHYVVDATFRVVAMADENRHEVLPIAIGEAPFVIPRPHESDNVLHVEIARTMASMIDRGGQL
jgi:16S rRNA C967 or C1407 C5-methylase (RsmB/RsmF family)